MAEMLTYAELAARIGRSELAAKSLAKRKSWRRIVGNDGLARIVIENDDLAELADPDRRGVGRPPANSSRAKASELRSNPLHELQARLAVAEALAIERKEAIDRECEKSAVLGRELSEALAVAATVEPLRATLQVLKDSLEADRLRSAELRLERDQWQKLAVAPRSWFGWRQKVWS